MHDDFDCDDVHVKLRNLVEDSQVVISTILMPCRPSTYKTIAMPNDLDEKI
jgi:hypothetical protein